MQKILVLIIALFLGLAFIYWLAAPSVSSQPEPTPTATSEEPVTDSTYLVLEGFSIELNASGNPVASPAMRTLFDSMATAMDEQPVDEWKHSILLPYQDQLSTQALQQLQTMLNHYVEYNLALQLFPMEGEPTLNAALSRLQHMRAHYLEEAGAVNLFSDWQKLEQFSNEAVALIRMESDPDKITQRLKAMVETLPASIQIRALTVVDNSQEIISIAAKPQSNPAELQQRAEQIVAASLIQPSFVFAEPSEAFREKYYQYKEAVADESSVEKIQTLRSHFFTGADKLRAETLDRFEQF